jgi:hypothetical protein
MESTYYKISHYASEIEELSYNNIKDYKWEEPDIEFLNPEFGSIGDIIKTFPGQLVGVLGASKEGKTTVLLQMLLYMAKRFNRRIVVFSPEHELMYHAKELNRSAGNKAKELIMQNFVFIQPKNGLMTTEMLLDKIDELQNNQKLDGVPITDIVVDPMNSLFNEENKMLGYSERIPLLVAFKKAAQLYGCTWWFTEHAKGKKVYQGKYLKMTEPEDYVYGREIHNKVDAFLTVNRIRIEKELPGLDGATEIKSIKTNVAEISNLGSKYQNAYKESTVLAAYNPQTSRFTFGDSAEYSAFDRRYIMRGNPVTPLSIFDKKTIKLASQENNLQIAKESNTEPPF